VAEMYKRISEEKKLLSDEKSTTKRKLDSLVQYIEQRKIKHQILLSTMRGPSSPATADDGDGDCDDEDEDLSSFRISEHRIRVAQEKLELQETGDRLDERVQKLETEIRAMENTLHVLNANNNCYKSGMSSVNPASQFTSDPVIRQKLVNLCIFVVGEEYKEKVALEETYEKLNSMWLQKKKTLENLENEIQVSTKYL